jgi:hypothetical protein
MKLKQTFKEQVCDRWHIVWEDLDTRASFVYLGEKLNPIEARKRLVKLLQTETWKPGEVYWIWKQIEAMSV